MFTKVLICGRGGGLVMVISHVDQCAYKQKGLVLVMVLNCVRDCAYWGDGRG